MWRRQFELQALDIDVLLVSFERLELLQGISIEDGFGWPVLADESRRGYELYGLERASFARVWLSPRTVWYYARAVLRGQRLRRPGSDSSQLGGDFLVDPLGRIALAFRSAEPADRPAIELILAARTRSD